MTRSQRAASAQLGVPLLLPGELVELCDEARMLDERVACGRGLDQLVREDVEPQAELLRQLRLPLLDQAPRGDDEASLQVPPQDEFAHEEPGHDRLPRSGVVGQDEPKGLSRQHLLVDGGDLVRQRHHV